MHRRILAVPGRCIGDQHQSWRHWAMPRHDVLGQQPSPWLWDWSCSRCSFPPPYGSWSVFPLLGWQGLQAHISGIATIDTGHSRRQQLNWSLTWKRQSSGKSGRCVGVLSLRSWAGKTELTAVTDQQTELTPSERWVHFCSNYYLRVRAVPETEVTFSLSLPPSLSLSLPLSLSPLSLSLPLSLSPSLSLSLPPSPLSLSLPPPLSPPLSLPLSLSLHPSFPPSLPLSLSPPSLAPSLSSVSLPLSLPPSLSLSLPLSPPLSPSLPLSLPPSLSLSPLSPSLPLLSLSPSPLSLPLSVSPHPLILVPDTLLSLQQECLAVNKTMSGPAGRWSTDTGRLTWPSACQTWENFLGKL